MKLMNLKREEKIKVYKSNNGEKRTDDHEARIGGNEFQIIPRQDVLQT